MNGQLKSGQRITWIGIGVNGILVVVKWTAGVFGGSQALIADAIHSLSDFLTDVVVLFGLAVGRKGPDEQHHFGHARIETMSTAAVGFILFIVGVFLGYDSAYDIYNHTEREPTILALSAALLSIFFKEALFQYTVRVGKIIKSSAVIANAWHHRSDSLSSIAVSIGILGAIINPSWHMLDAYAALVVSFMICGVGLQISWKALREMVDTAPEESVLLLIRERIAEQGGVKSFHDLKVRCSGGLILVQVHIVVDGTMSVYDGHSIASRVKHVLLRELPDILEVIVHIDPS